MWRTGKLAGIVLLLLSFETECLAVIPSIIAPLQALLSLIPQIIALLLAGLAALFSIGTWRMWFGQVLRRRWLTYTLCAGGALVCVTIAIGLF